MNQKQVAIIICIFIIVITCIMLILSAVGIFPLVWITIIVGVSTLVSTLLSFLQLISTQTPPPPPGPPIPVQNRVLKVLIALSLLVLVSDVIFALVFAFPRKPPPPPPPNTIPCYHLSATNPHVCPDISDGTRAFDLSDQDRPAGYTTLKHQVIARLAQGDYQGALKLWENTKQTYINESGSKLSLNYTNDAEMLIYLEDQEILHRTTNYITLVVTTVFPSRTPGSRDVLQGVYTLQREAETRPTKLLLLIANANGGSDEAITVSREIVQAAQEDKTTLGVIGWPYSQFASPALKTLSDGHLPMISPTASDDKLTGASKFFFRVAPPNFRQAAVAALFAKQKNAQHILVFYGKIDPFTDDPYTYSLAHDFSQNPDVSSSIADIETYTEGDPTSILAAWNAAMGKARDNSYTPDLVYFAGYSDDASSLLGDLPACLPSPCLKVLGGDGLYVVKGYTEVGKINYNRLSFTAFAFPDEWKSIPGLGNPSFFNDYILNFDPAGKYQGGAYGWERPDADVILSYDAVGVAMYAFQMAMPATSDALQQALTKVTGSLACRGISGLIDFQNGDPYNKAIVMLTVNQMGLTQLAPIGKQFYQDQLANTHPFCFNPSGAV